MDQPGRISAILHVVSSTGKNNISLSAFLYRADWNDSRTPEAASAAPIGKPENQPGEYGIGDVMPLGANVREILL